MDVEERLDTERGDICSECFGMGKLDHGIERAGVFVESCDRCNGTGIEPESVAEDTETNRLVDIRRKLCDAYEGEYEVRVEWENGVIAIGIIKELTTMKLWMARRSRSYPLDGIISVEPIESKSTDESEPDTAEDTEANLRGEMAKKLHDAMEGGYEVRIEWETPDVHEGVVADIEWDENWFIMHNDLHGKIRGDISTIVSIEPISETITGGLVDCDICNGTGKIETTRQELEERERLARIKLFSEPRDIHGNGPIDVDECEPEDETATSVDEIKEALCKARDMHFEATIVDNDLNSHTGTVSACGEDRFAFLSDGETRAIFYEDIQEVSLHPNFRKKRPGTWKPRADDVILLDVPRTEPGVENQKWERHGFYDIIEIIDGESRLAPRLVCTVSSLGNIDSEKKGNLITVAPELAKAALDLVNGMGTWVSNPPIQLIRLLKKAGIKNVAPWLTDE